MSEHCDILRRLDRDHHQFAARGGSSLFGDAAAEIRTLRARIAAVEMLAGEWARHSADPRAYAAARILDTLNNPVGCTCWCHDGVDLDLSCDCASSHGGDA